MRPDGTRVACARTGIRRFVVTLADQGGPMRFRRKFPRVGRPLLSVALLALGLSACQPEPSGGSGESKEPAVGVAQQAATENSNINGSYNGTYNGSLNGSLNSSLNG